MQERVIHFDTPHEFSEVLGKGRSVSTAVAAAFAVKLTARDSWLKIQSETDDEEAIDRCERYINLLREARDNGVTLIKHTKLYALKACAKGEFDRVKELFSENIQVATGRHPIFPRTFGQQEYVTRIQKNDLTFGCGPAGTGKTYLAMAMAVNALMEEKVSRIILTRPAVEAGESLGFLPGDMHQKVLPYLRPLYDALYDMMPPDTIQKHMERGVIEVAPLAYMRGRTLNSAFIILDEAQNTTPEQMMMFLTRLGFDSTCVVTGDPSQVDLPKGRKSGLAEAVRILDGVKGIGVSKLDESDVVRHELVQKIIRAYREDRNGPDKGTTEINQDGGESE